MSAERRFDVCVTAFVAACLVFMVAVPGFQTVPFHWSGIGLTLLAGVRLRPVRATRGVVAVVGVATGAAMLLPGGAGRQSAVEITEVPLMAAMYLTMVWHARRRERALARVDRAVSRQPEFVHDAAHSLRTPLTIARGYLEPLDDRLVDGPTARTSAWRSTSCAASPAGPTVSSCSRRTSRTGRPARPNRS